MNMGASSCIPFVYWNDLAITVRLVHSVSFALSSFLGKYTGLPARFAYRIPFVSPVVKIAGNVRRALRIVFTIGGVKHLYAMRTPHVCFLSGGMAKTVDGLS